MAMRFAVPLLLLGGLLLLFALGLQRDPALLPSPLIGQAAPSVLLPVLGQSRLVTTPGPSTPVLVNFWASWCTPCLQEHPLLMQAAADGVTIVGINYKDEPGAAAAWLSRHGNPYQLVLQDLDGRGGIEWGVYGVPESFAVDGASTVQYKHVGPLSREDLRQYLLPHLPVSGG